MQELQKWYQRNEKTIVEDYFNLLRFPSISTDPKYKKDVLACAKWVQDYLDKSGFHTECIETPVYPLVYAEEIVSKDLPTVLIYGHYDVQPADPLDEWEADPFEPLLKGKKVIARGAQDNKGQVMYVIAALRALKEIHKKLPVNIKVIIEGEEESASNGLEKSLPKLKEKLAADYLMIVDMDIPEVDVPAVTIGCRGIYTMSLELTGSNIDLHSGQHGGIVYNPLRALVQLLAKLWDEKGRIQIPHFYDDVLDLEKEHKDALDFSFDREGYEKMYETGAFWREEGFSEIEANWIRPSLEINGISGGYAGDGFKTVIPKKAVAKLSCRLVPSQDPKKIGENLKKFLHSEAIPGMKIKIEEHGMGYAARGSLSSPLLGAVTKAYEEVFEKPCQKTMSGGSVPIVADLQKTASADVLLMGVGHESDHIHAPNESFDLDRLEKGFYVIGKAIENLG